MGCTTSKQGFHGNKRRENVASWYDPLPRSVSDRPYLRSPPCEPLPHTQYDHSFDVEDPAVTGSFIRLLHKKKSLSPLAGHQQHGDHHAHILHSHTCHHYHAHAESKKHAHASNCNHKNCTIKDLDDFGASSQLQQLQLANLSSTYKQKLGNILATANEAPHLIEDVADDDAPSFRYYPKHLPLHKDMRSMVQHVGGDGGCDGDDEQMHIDDSSDVTDGGLRQRRKSRFAPRPTKPHHVKTKSTEKSLSFNISLDDGFTELESPAWPRRKMLEEQSTSLKKRKNSSEFLASNMSLDGLEEQLQYKRCDRLGSNAEHIPRIEGFSEVESSNVIIDCNDLSVGTESSAFNEEIPGGLQLNTPFRSPARSPTMSSLKSSTSPLFDPSILAAFEEAVESVRYSAPDDDWTLVNDASNEPSSLSSSDKFTWVSSEPSSDEESARHSDEIFASNLHEMSYAAFLHEESDQNKRQKVDGMFSGLDRFEFRCPPKGEDKIVLYFTSLRGVRKTYQDCCALRLIMQGLGVDVDERDVWMHLKFREELADLLGERGLPVPRLFIKGRYIGGVEEVKQLHEDGLLVRLIEDLPTFGKFRKSCDGCADMRFIPCLTCSGSCKLLDDELDEMVKCFECNENGLIMCPMCSSC